MLVRNHSRDQSIGPSMCAREMREFAGQARPVSPCEGATAQAWVARDRVSGGDAAQDRIFEFKRRDLLRRADKFLGAYTLTQSIASHRRPSDIPNSRRLVVGGRQHAPAIGAERRAQHKVGMTLQDRNFLSGLRLP